MDTAGYLKVNFVDKWLTMKSTKICTPCKFLRMCMVDSVYNFERMSFDEICFDEWSSVKNYGNYEWNNY